jgi:hypothetical protein
MNLKTKIGRARLYYRCKRFFTLGTPKREPLNELQTSVIDLVKKVMCKKDAELLISPMSSMFYINWKHITVKISDKNDELIVMNGRYYYYFYLPSIEMYDIRKKFLRAISHRQGAWESKFNAHALTSIKMIMEEIEECK